MIKVSETSWVEVIEFPDDSLCLMGILSFPLEHDRDFRCTQIRFSREAIKKIIPLMQKWIDDK